MLERSFSYIAREGKGREGKGREGKGREGKGREGKGREGKGREGKGRGEVPVLPLCCITKQTQCFKTATAWEFLTTLH